MPQRKAREVGPRATNTGLEQDILGLEAQLSSATDSVHGSKKNPLPSAKCQRDPKERKGETWGLQTVLQTRIIADCHAASSVPRVGGCTSQEELGTTACVQVQHCSASAANKPQLLQEYLAVTGNFSESPAPRNPSFYRRMKVMSDTGFLQVLAVASPER